MRPEPSARCGWFGRPDELTGRWWASGAIASRVAPPSAEPTRATRAGYAALRLRLRRASARGSTPAAGVLPRTEGNDRHRTPDPQRGEGGGWGVRRDPEAARSTYRSATPRGEFERRQGGAGSYPFADHRGRCCWRTGRVVGPAWGRVGRSRTSRCFVSALINPDRYGRCARLAGRWPRPAARCPRG